MKSFMVLFSGWQKGWVGPSTTYTITVRGKTQAEAVASLPHRIEKIKRVRQLKGES